MTRHSAVQLCIYEKVVRIFPSLCFVVYCIRTINPTNGRKSTFRNLTHPFPSTMITFETILVESGGNQTYTTTVFGVLSDPLDYPRLQSNTRTIRFRVPPRIRVRLCVCTFVRQHMAQRIMSYNDSTTMVVEKKRIRLILPEIFVQRAVLLSYGGSNEISIVLFFHDIRTT